MKLAILGGGGVRMPAFVRAVLASRPGTFDEICLFEPDPARRDTICRLAAELATVLGHPGVVTRDRPTPPRRSPAPTTCSPRSGSAATGAGSSTSRSRCSAASSGQETTGPGGCAMALRTIPVVLSYCDLLSRCSPDAVLINFTNPAGPDHPGDLAPRAR